MAKEQFQNVMRDALVGLPQDLKAMLRIMEDPDLEDEQRVLVAGSLLHTLSEQNAIPGIRGILGRVGDVTVMRLVLERLEAAAPDIIAQHRKDSPDLLEPLVENMGVVREYLGGALAVLEKSTDQLPKVSFQGYSAIDCAKDEDAGTWLYDAVHEALVDGRLDLDEDDVDRELRGVARIKTALEQRMTS